MNYEMFDGGEENTTGKYIMFGFIFLAIFVIFVIILMFLVGLGEDDPKTIENAKLLSDVKFYPGDTWLSNSGVFKIEIVKKEIRLTLKNAVIFKIQATANIKYLTITADGKFMAIGPDNKVAWEADYTGVAGSTVSLQSDGNIVVYTPDFKPLWESETNHTENRI
jgi:hypothetical protein